MADALDLVDDVDDRIKALLQHTLATCWAAGTPPDCDGNTSDDPRIGAVGDHRSRFLLKYEAKRWWAAGYNLISVPLAAGVLASVGFVLPMSIGAILMSLSAIIVAADAQLLRRRRPRTRRHHRYPN
ncbi:hypothetical protein A3K89_17610 [Rhodococcoides kyotonense]|uniref:Cu+-exporting ATPase n=1 Tax=Rhodococcoides kyotonense TaxID=398843 RepID=A0A177YML9_9NOCA|nr:hypothetical protein A3K89_17610 [Rhodococcus kyotonensis]